MPHEILALDAQDITTMMVCFNAGKRFEHQKIRDTEMVFPVAVLGGV